VREKSSSPARRGHVGRPSRSRVSGEGGGNYSDAWIMECKKRPRYSARWKKATALYGIGQDCRTVQHEDSG
jgi:hypothetical protein